MLCGCRLPALPLHPRFKHAIARTRCPTSLPPTRAQWKVELKGMADRILSMRQQLFDALTEGEPGLDRGSKKTGWLAWRK
jgi:hypothetical protein